MCIHTLTYALEQKGKCTFERTKGKSSAELGSFQASVAPEAPFLLMFGFSPAGWAVSLLSSNK